MYQKFPGKFALSARRPRWVIVSEGQGCCWNTARGRVRVRDRMGVRVRVRMKVRMGVRVRVRLKLKVEL